MTAPAFVLLTRPRAASERFAARLQKALGNVQIRILPVLEIVSVGAVPRLSDYAGVIFTSANAVARVAGNGAGQKAWCVGDATAAEAAAKGFDAWSAGGDAADLVGMILEAGAEGPLVHLRGVYGRGSVAETLTQSGIRTEEAVVYRQDPADPGGALEAAFHERSWIVPVFSPRSSARLCELLPTDACPPLVVAISEAAAAAWEGARAQVIVAGAPTAEAMVQAIGEAAGASTAC